MELINPREGVVGMWATSAALNVVGNNLEVLSGIIKGLDGIGVIRSHRGPNKVLGGHLRVLRF